MAAQQDGTELERQKTSDPQFDVDDPRSLFELAKSQPKPIVPSFFLRCDDIHNTRSTHVDPWALRQK
jgi:hypothetical protein